ncbi:hypothetical protein CLOM_g297, partial [Closterium sp. NIES-68]
LDAAAPSRGAAASWAAPLAGGGVGADGARVALTGCGRRGEWWWRGPATSAVFSVASAPLCWPMRSPDNIFHLIRDDLAMPSVASPICDSNF